MRIWALQPIGYSNVDISRLAVLVVACLTTMIALKMGSGDRAHQVVLFYLRLALRGYLTFVKLGIRVDRETNMPLFRLSPPAFLEPIKYVARVCGNIRVALTVCEVAFAERLKELENHIAVAGPEATSSSSSRGAASPSATVGGGDDNASSPHGGGGGGQGSGNCPPSLSSSPTGSAVTSSVLLTVAGAKAAINSVMQR